MNGRSNLVTAKQLILDTFRQANASGITWMMLAVTALCVVLCLSVSVSGDTPIYADDEPGFFLPRKFGTSPEAARKEGVETIGGEMTLAFGAVSIPLGRDRADSVHFLEMLLAGGIAGTLGVLLALVWSAGFMPAFLEPQASSVLLAKPAARWQLLLGKYFGVLTFVGGQVVLFVGFTWLALGVRTAVWDGTYLWCIPLLLLQFAIFYSFSVLLAVLTRSTTACVFGSVLFWLLAWGINYGTVMARTMPESLSPFTLALADAAYWISPKPIDSSLILFNALGGERHFEKPPVFQLLESWQAFSAPLSILSSFAITAVLLALSVHELNATDY
jgi:ABC-type transport system involved in multi-copper enzyme maturation permease subunit